MNSSITTAAPALPKLPSNIASSAARRLRRGLGDDHALAGGEPVGLDHDRQAETAAAPPRAAPRSVTRA